MADLYSIKTSPLCVQNAVFREKDVKKTERERAGGRWREAGWKRDSSKCQCYHCLWKHRAAGASRGLPWVQGAFGDTGHEDKGSWGHRTNRPGDWGPPPAAPPRCHGPAEDTHCRNTSFLLRNLKKVGSHTSPRRRHVSVQACCPSDSHTCRESAGGQAWGSRRALGDHIRWVALGDRTRGLGGLCIAGLWALAGGGGDGVVQKSWKGRE